MKPPQMERPKGGGTVSKHSSHWKWRVWARPRRRGYGRRGSSFSTGVHIPGEDGDGSGGTGRRGPRSRAIRRLLASAAAMCFTFWLAFSYGPNLGVSWNTVAERAALASAMLNMPQGSLALLEHRFADKLTPSTDETEVTPYVTDWTEPQSEADAPSSASGSGNSAAPQKNADSSDISKAPGPAPAGKVAERPEKPPAPTPAKDETGEIPTAYQGKILQENLAGTGSPLVSWGAGLIRNSTETANDEVSKILEDGMNVKLEETDEPQVLIVHTHATESYEPLDSETFDTRETWRNTDNQYNMTAVGDAMEKVLKDAGIGVVHDKTQHDYPSYNGAYDRSAATIQKYLKKYPTIKIVLDVHRDAILRADDLTVKPVVEINGKKAAQLMIITGCEDGSMNVPKWRENLRFAASLQDAIEQKYPYLTRPIFFCYRKYNMDLTTGSLLLEIGSNANTLEESIYSAQLIGDALADLLNGELAAPGEDTETAVDGGSG